MNTYMGLRDAYAFLLALADDLRQQGQHKLASELERCVADLHADEIDRDAEINRLETCCGDLTTERDDLVVRVVDRDNEIARLKAERDDLALRVVALEHDVDSMISPAIDDEDHAR